MNKSLAHQDPKKFERTPLEDLENSKSICGIQNTVKQIMIKVTGQKRKQKTQATSVSGTASSKG